MKKTVICILILLLAVAMLFITATVAMAAPDPTEAPAEGTDEGGTVTILGITTVPAIVILCLLIGYGVKVSPLGDEYIPLIVGVAGGVIGLIAYHIMPDFPGQDPIWAVAIGVASGLAATGVHQAYKQLTKAKSAAEV